MSSERIRKNSRTYKRCGKGNNLEDKIKLSGAFCLGKCTEGVSIKIDDEIICGVSPDNFDDIFKKHVLDKI